MEVWSGALFFSYSYCLCPVFSSFFDNPQHSPTMAEEVSQQWYLIIASLPFSSPQFKNCITKVIFFFCNANYMLEACDHGFCHSIPVLLKKLCLYFSLFIHYGWQPTPVLLPGESRGWRSLVGYSPRVTKSRTWMSDFTFTLLSYSISS